MKHADKVREILCEATDKEILQMCFERIEEVLRKAKVRSACVRLPQATSSYDDMYLHWSSPDPKRGYNGGFWLDWENPNADIESGTPRRLFAGINEEQDITPYILRDVLYHGFPALLAAVLKRKPSRVKQPA